MRGWGAAQFFLPGITRVWDKRAVRVYNKLGRAYGFSVDNAYVLNMETGQAFFLTAAVYTNDNGTVPGSVLWVPIRLPKLALRLARTLPPPEHMSSLPGP